MEQEDVDQIEGDNPGDNLTETDLGLLTAARIHISSHSHRPVPSDKSSTQRSLSLQLEYRMDHSHRGTALIFDNFSFQHLPFRRGSERDRDSLQTALVKLGFNVNVMINADARDIKDKLETVANNDHTDADCFLCVFLTHGDDGIIYGKDGNSDDISTQLLLQDLYDLYRGENCSSLVGKPKMFIVQACRGTQFEDGIESFIETDALSTNVYEIEEGTKPTIPSGADFLISYSSSKGYFAHRDTVYGSWFIQDLVSVLENYGTSAEFTQLLTLVNNMVAKRTVEMALDLNLVGKKQMPCFLSMLTKQLYFSVK